MNNCEVSVSCPSLKSLKYQTPLPLDIILENLFSVKVVTISVTDITTYPFEEIGILVNKMIKEFPSTSALKLCITSVSVKFSSLG